MNNMPKWIDVEAEILREGDYVYLKFWRKPEYGYYWLKVKGKDWIYNRYAETGKMTAFKLGYLDPNGDALYWDERKLCFRIYQGTFHYVSGTTLLKFTKHLNFD